MRDPTILYPERQISIPKISGDRADGFANHVLLLTPCDALQGHLAPETLRPLERHAVACK